MSAVKRAEALVRANHEARAIADLVLSGKSPTVEQAEAYQRAKQEAGI